MSMFLTKENADIIALDIFGEKFIIFTQYGFTRYTGKEVAKVLLNPERCKFSILPIEEGIVQVNACIDYLRKAKHYTTKTANYKQRDTALHVEWVEYLYNIECCKSAFYFAICRLGLPFIDRHDDLRLLLSTSYPEMQPSLNFIASVDIAVYEKLKHRLVKKELEKATNELKALGVPTEEEEDEDDIYYSGYPFGYEPGYYDPD